MTDHVINWDDWNESVRRDLYWCAEELLSQVPDAHPSGWPCRRAPAAMRLPWPTWLASALARAWECPELSGRGLSYAAPVDCPRQSRATAKSATPNPRQAGIAAHSHGSAPVAR